MPCPNCQKEGLALLPVRYAVAPNEAGDAAPLPKPLGDHVTDKTLKGSQYILRQLDRGYVYVLYPTKGTRPSRWAIYEVGPDACMNIYDDPIKVPATPTDKPLEMSCKQKKEDHSAQTIAIRGAKYIKHVWIAFSRYRLPKSVLDVLEKTPEPRMQKLDVKAALAGGAVQHALPATPENLIKHVADFAKPDAWKKLHDNGQFLAPLNARHDDVAPIAERMAEIAAKTGGKGYILALFDPIGITAELNHFRNIEAGKLVKYQGDPTRMRERFVGDVIEGCKALYEKNGHAAVWKERFQGKSPLYEADRLKADREQYELEVKTRDQRIDTASDDVAKWNKACDTDRRWHDFDGKDEQSAKDRLDAFAACVHGMGKTKAEQNLWDLWFAANPQDPHTPLWGALGSAAPSLWTYFTGPGLPEIGKMEKAHDTVKGLIDAHEEYQAWREKHAPAPALATVSVATAAQLPRLIQSHPELYRKVGYYLMVMSTAVTNTKFSPLGVEVKHAEELIVALQRGVWGSPKGAALRLMQAEAKTGRRVYIASADGIVHWSRESTTLRQTILQMWLPEQGAAQAALQVKPTAPLALPPPQSLTTVNPFQKLLAFAKTGLPWVGFVLASLNLAAVGKSMTGPNGLDRAGDAWSGLLAGVLGFSGAVSELTSMGLRKGVLPQATLLQVVSRLGGGLVVATALAEGVQMLFKAEDQEAKDNDDAEKYYKRAGYLFLAAGGAGFLGTIAGASGAGALFSIPVFGWTLLVVGLVGAAFWLAWQGSEAEYTPLEDWIKHSYYGTATKDRYGPSKEKEELSKIQYAYRLETNWVGMPRGVGFNAGPAGFDYVSFKLTLPAASTSSVLQATIELLDATGQVRKTVLNGEIIRPVNVPAGLLDPHMPELRPMPAGKPAPQDFYWEDAPRLRGDARQGYEYAGTLRVDSWQYEGARIQLAYQPDPQTQPDLVIPFDKQPVEVKRGWIYDMALMP